MFAAESVPYKNTKSFNAIVLSYLAGDNALSSFYSFTPTEEGIANAIAQKKEQSVNREALSAVLEDQYKSIAPSPEVARSLELLRAENTFTVCTAHQPNIFTGPLYFIYKILHAIKLAKTLSEKFPEQHFVPVYYMGSEDADLEELNHTYIDGKKYEWKTGQKGAVGKMQVDADLIALIEAMNAQLGVSKNGEEFIALLKESYQKGSTIQHATFTLVNTLFGGFGLLVLVADDARLKSAMLPVFEADLFNASSSGIVEKTSGELSKHFSVQAQPRSINLFYFKDNIRERIERNGDIFQVVNTQLTFTEEAMRAELKNHPERFSPNVILRALYQETILPNIAFIGGGGELAYWLQLKDLFSHYNIIFPVLVLRNSFLVMEKRWTDLEQKLGLSTEQLFLPQTTLLNDQIKAAGAWPTLSAEIEKLTALYDSLKTSAANIDPTLLQHIEALKAKAVKDLSRLEQKMQRAERRKKGDFKNQLATLKNGLFPRGGLQERSENIGYFYAKWGREFIDEIYRCSHSLEQEFVVVKKGL